MKTILPIAFAATAAFAAAAYADDHPRPADFLPPAAIVHQLVQDGHSLEKLELEHGLYHARIAVDAAAVTVAVDPVAGLITDHADHAPRAARQDRPPAIDAAAATAAAAAQGYWDLREIELKNGAWKVEAADDSGVFNKVRIDATTGRVL